MSWAALTLRARSSKKDMHFFSTIFHYGSVWLLSILSEVDAIQETILTREFYENIKNKPMSVRRARGPLQCVHFGVRTKGCKTVAFRQNQTGYCFLYDSLTKNDVEDVQGENLALQGVAYFLNWEPKSCREAYGEEAMVSSGTLALRGIGEHYCKRKPRGCTNEGWTLAMKVDGSQSTFKYSSKYWTNAKTYDEENCLLNITSCQEGKFKAFVVLPFTSICLAMVKDGGKWRGLELPIRAASLHEMFKRNKYIPSTVGRKNWKLLIRKSSSQQFCNQEGINNETPSLKARIGIISNNHRNCLDVDSFIGVGLPYFGAFKASSGNFARYQADNEDANIITTSYILIR